jgi:hypothetical protein
MCVNVNIWGCLGAQPVDLGVFGGQAGPPAVPLTAANMTRHGKLPEPPRCDTVRAPHGATADALRAASCVCAREVQMQCALGVVLWGGRVYIYVHMMCMTRMR